MKKVIIKNLKNITNLEFEIPGSGVWVLTGKNGSGKSTLLGVLWRIKEPTAFQQHFPSSEDSDLDNHEGAEISYIVNDDGEEISVTYKRRNIRWPPTPKRNTFVLDKFGYHKVEFIKVDEKRIFPRKEEFQPNKRRIRRASNFIINGVNTTFNTTRFENLKVFNVMRGISPAYLINIGRGKYYSEKSFSLGELNVIRLLERLDQLRDKGKSLILIDEFDMALHPTAQIRLINVLEKYANEYDHTIMFSTHSASIIRNIDMQKVMHIETREDGSSVIINNPPMYKVLEDISGHIHASEGPRVFCEDEMAKKFILAAYVSFTEKNNIDQILFTPMICGSWTQVLDRANETNREGNRFIAIPDADIVEIAGHDGYQKRISGIEQYVRPMPVTPEQAIISYIINSKNDFLYELRKVFIDNAIPCSSEKLEEVVSEFIISDDDRKSIISGSPYEKRNTCKRLLKKFMELLQSEFQNFDISIDMVVKSVINLEFNDKDRYNKWCQVMGPLHDILNTG